MFGKSFLSIRLSFITTKIKIKKMDLDRGSKNARGEFYYTTYPKSKSSMPSGSGSSGSGSGSSSGHSKTEMYMSKYPASPSLASRAFSNSKYDPLPSTSKYGGNAAAYASAKPSTSKTSWTFGAGGAGGAGAAGGSSWNRAPFDSKSRQPTSKPELSNTYAMPFNARPPIKPKEHIYSEPVYATRSKYIAPSKSKYDKK